MKNTGRQTTGTQLTEKKRTNKPFRIQYVTKETVTGLGIILGFQILKSIFVYFYYAHLSQHLSAKALANRMNHPDPIIGGIVLCISAVSIGSFIAGGFFGTKNSKKPGWITGAIVGICWDVLILVYALGSTILAGFFPHLLYGSHITGTQITDFQKSLPLRFAYAFIFAFINFSIPLTALGGWLEKKITKAGQ